VANCLHDKKDGENKKSIKTEKEAAPQAGGLQPSRCADRKTSD
jgi:hypothetical protein